MGADTNILLAQMYWKQSNPEENRVFLIIVISLVLLPLLFTVFSRLLRGQKIFDTQPKAKTLSRGAFRRKAEEYGFSISEAEFLDYYARKLGTINPSSVFGSMALLDTFLRNVFKYIERHAETEDLAIEQKHKLFLIRESLGARSSSGKSFRSTRQLKPKTPLSIVTPKGTQYSTILVLNESNGMYLEPPLDAFGVPIRIGMGTKLNFYYYTGAHVGYNFISRSRGLVDIDGRKFLSARHSEKIKALPARRHQRSQIKISARFYLVHVRAAKDRGKVVKTVQVEKAPVAGIVIDISGGGLSMQTLSPANIGNFIKLEFDLGLGLRSAYATVIRVSKIRSGALMHLKFIKINPKTVNEIRAVVYGYD